MQVELEQVRSRESGFEWFSGFKFHCYFFREELKAEPLKQVHAQRWLLVILYGVSFAQMLKAPRRLLFIPRAKYRRQRV